MLHKISRIWHVQGYGNQPVFSLWVSLTFPFWRLVHLHVHDLTWDWGWGTKGRFFQRFSALTVSKGPIWIHRSGSGWSQQRPKKRGIFFQNQNFPKYFSISLSKLFIWWSLKLHFHLQIQTFSCPLYFSSSENKVNFWITLLTLSDEVSCKFLNLYVWKWARTFF